MTTNKDFIESVCGLGHVYYLTGRATTDQSEKYRYLSDAKSVLITAFGIYPTQNSGYNIASISAVLDQEEECKVVFYSTPFYFHIRNGCTEQRSLDYYLINHSFLMILIY